MDRTAGRVLLVETTGGVVDGLRGEQTGLEVDDFLRLFRGQIDRRLRVTAGRVVRLVEQILIDRAPGR